MEMSGNSKTLGIVAQKDMYAIGEASGRQSLPVGWNRNIGQTDYCVTESL